MQVQADTIELKLTRKEYSVLYLLLQNQPLTEEEKEVATNMLVDMIESCI